MARSSSESDETDSENDAGDLVDIEADEDSSNEDPEHDDDDGDEFTLFMTLPPELRLRIWQLYCPDLVSKGRLVPIPTTFAAFDTSPRAMALPAQTEHMRMLSAVHRETRKLVVSAYPTILPMRHDGQLRFNADRDVAYIEIGGDNDEDTDWALVRTIFEQTPRVCLSSNDLIIHQEQFHVAVSSTSRLEKLFLWREGTTSKSDNWCGSPLIHHSVIETSEISANLGEDLRWIYCWPDLERHRDFATIHVGRVDEWKSPIPGDFWSLFSEMGIEVWPLVSWEYENLEHYYSLVEKYDAGLLEDLSGSDDEEDENEDDEGESPSEYESDGIDDAEIISVHSPSEDELVPNAPVTLDTSPPASVDHDAEDARFSSVEVDSAEGEEPPVELVARRPKRHIVSDSDDESGSEQPMAKRQRTRPVVVSDSSDSDADEGGDVVAGNASQHARSRRRAQVISSDSESSSGEKDDEDQSDKSEDGSESGSDGTAGNPPQRLTLAERLQQHRSRYPDRQVDGRERALSEDGGSEENSDDDDNEEDESEADSEEDEDGLIDAMAEDSDGEGEEEDDEEGR